MSEHLYLTLWQIYSYQNMQRKTQKERGWWHRAGVPLAWGSKMGAVSTEINLQHCRETQSYVIDCWPPVHAPSCRLSAFTWCTHSYTHTHVCIKRVCYIKLCLKTLKGLEVRKRQSLMEPRERILFVSGGGDGGGLTGSLPLLLKRLYFCVFFC